MEPVSSYIQTAIDRLSPGAIIRHADFDLPPEHQMALAKTLSRMSKKGIIERLEKGIYYKPKKTAFGSVRPSEREILSSIIEAKQGYITDTAAANTLGVTTQLPREIVIASKSYRPPRKIGGLTIRFRRAMIQPVGVGSNPPTIILQILDSLRIIKRIPDASVDNIISVIIKQITSLPQSQKKELISCALKYNPSVRAIIGAIFSRNFKSIAVGSLARSLNPLSVYKIGISSKLLPNKKDWYIQ